MNRFGTVAPLIVILAAPLVMLYPLWTNPLSAGEDDVIHYYPLRKMVGRALREGRWPVDNPYEATGAPLMGDPQSAVMYPPTWLFAALGAKLAYSISIFLGFSLAGGGAYAYLRRVGLVRAASMFGAVVFMFCGFMVGHRVHLSMIHTAAYLPWGLWCIEGFRGSGGGVGSGRPRVFAPAGAMVPVAYLAITSGHWPTLIHVGLIWFVYFGLRVWPFGARQWRAVVPACGAAALAAVIAGPQLLVTAELMGHVTRGGLGLMVAGENSFFPVAGVLAFFPMLMGSRWPNFFPQQWWGPWHLCEMLGYVGLVTLPLAGAAVWWLRPRRGGGVRLPETNAAGGIVRLWAWLALGAGVWMLGYYIPAYWLIQKVPVLGMVRCPARMVLVVDLALAVLAGAAVHAVCVGDTPGALGRTIRRGVTVVLPAAMLGCLVVLGVAGWAGRDLWGWGGRIPFPFVGGAGDVLAAVSPANPAVWIQGALLVASIAAVWFWLGGPRRRAPLLVGLVLVDLFFITRFVDAPGNQGGAAGPDVSPAAAWLTKHADGDLSKDSPRAYRVWGLSTSYHHRPAELLLPKTAGALGIATINSYGPFQSPRHAHLFGFRVFGTARNWRRLIRDNRLLSAYKVRYILAADRRYREVIESVRTEAGGAAALRAIAGAKNLLADSWQLDAASRRGGLLILQSRWLWWSSRAAQPLRLADNEPAGYRISLEVRGGVGGAAGMLKAEVWPQSAGWIDWEDNPTALVVYPEQISRRWRRFEWTFPASAAGGASEFVVTWMGQGSAEVRNISLRAVGAGIQAGESDRAPGGRSGREVYHKVAELPPVRPGEPAVAIYENLLCRSDVEQHPVKDGAGRDGEAEIERFKWSAAGRNDEIPPDVAIPPGAHPSRWFGMLTLPGVGLYAVVLTIGWIRKRR